MSLPAIAWISLAVAGLCAALLALDETRRPQAMAVMNIVWPITALYFSGLAVLAYMRFGRSKPGAPTHMQPRDKRMAFTASQVAVGTSHCGAGCAIADIATEFALASTGFVLFGSALYTSFLLDFLAAWALGIVFQYFAIKPMRPELSPAQAIFAAIKADTLSILAFQIGMYAVMAFAHVHYLSPAHITAFDPRYWLVMQGAMIAGFATSYPMNAFLIRQGLKEAM